MLHRLLVLLVLALLIPAMLFAKGTAAGTEIKNQASATYQDADNNAHTATSNMVVTTVQPVYSFTVTPNGADQTAPGQTQITTPGNTVYFPYKIENTSNTAERFKMTSVAYHVASSTFVPTDLKVFNDTNQNGIVDPGETEIAVNGTTPVVPADGFTYIVVTYKVPGTATATQLANVNVSFQANADATVNDTDNYNRTTVVNDGVLTATMSADKTEGNPGDTIKFTVTGSNSGNAPVKSRVDAIDFGGGNTQDGVLVYNALPADYEFSGTDPVIGGPSGSVAVYSADGLTWTTTKPADPTTVRYIGLFMPDATPANNTSENVLAAGQTYKLSYDLKIKAGTPGKVITDDAEVRYANTAGNQLTTTNKVDVTVLSTATADVFVGRKSNAEDDTLTAGDNQLASAAAGATIFFENQAKNKGTSSDIINLIADATDLPAGTAVTFYHLDGTTPLTDTNSDGLPDLGILAANATKNFKVKIILPGNATNANAPHNLVITAKSSNNPAETEPTTDQILAITESSVVIGNYNGAGAPNTTPIDKNGNPGTTVYFPLDILNNGSQADTFTLSSNIPAGWIITYYHDKDGDGVLDADEMTPITSTPSVAAGAEGHVIAAVQVPAGTANATYNTTFTATSSLNNTKTSSITDTVTVPKVPALTFEPNRSGTGIPGGTVTYDHVLTNKGNFQDTFALSFANGSQTYVFLDGVTNDVITNVVLAAGASKTIKVKAFIATNAPINIVDTVTATATSAENVNIKASVIDSTLIVAGLLQMAKSVDKAAAKPGEALTYTVNYKNTSSGILKNIVVVDAVPSNTTFVSATAVTAPAGTIIEYSADGVTYFNTVAGAGGAAAVRYLRWKIGNGANVAAGFDSSLTAGAPLIFQVTINN